MKTFSKFILEMENKSLIIMRGLSGSGKSTKARELAGTTGVVYSTDDFFYDKDGNYRFDASKLNEFHKKNQERAEQAMKQGISPIVIDNTNTQAWEMKPYVNSADRHGYDVSLHTPDTPWAWNADELQKRNTHNVPKEVIQRTLDRFQHNLTLDDIRRS